jgi:hypothetical protein
MVKLLLMTIDAVIVLLLLLPLPFLKMVSYISMVSSGNSC